jgi:hypothetical protein
MAPLDVGQPSPITYEPVPLSNETLARLREASGWSRFIAIAGFVLTGLLALLLVILLGVTQMEAVKAALGNGKFVLIFVPVALLLIAAVSGAALVWGYGRGVARFFTHGEPSLTHAFKSLRHFFTLWTILLALTSVLKLIAVLGKLM